MVRMAGHACPVLEVPGTWQRLWRVKWPAPSGLDDGGFFQEVRIEFHAQAGAGGDRDDAVLDFEIRRVPGFLFGGGAGDVLHVRAGIRRGGGELQDVHAGGAPKKESWY